MANRDHVSQLAGHFEQAILSGELAPGDLLPSERELSASMGISRSVVREALGRLASLGLVRSQHGSGTRVEVPTSKQVTVGYQRLLTGAVFKLEDLSAVRLPLETTIAGLAALKRTDQDLAVMDRTQKVLGNPKRALEAHVKADLDFHQALADATGNALFATVLTPIQQLLVESRRRTLGRYGAAIAYRHHAKILAAVRAQDARAAEREMRRHIEANFRHLKAAADDENNHAEHKLV